MKLYEVFRKLQRIVKRFYWRYSLSNKDFSLVSNNCLGGVILHQLGVRFNSPFVNLFICAEDYVTLLENLDKYLKEKIENVTPVDSKYPIGLLGGRIMIHFMHYNTFESAVECWYRRCERINMDNLYIIMSERDGCTLEHIKRFDKLPYQHKVIFCSFPQKEVKSLYYVKGFEALGEVDMLLYQPGYLSPLWKFNWPVFFNQR